MTEIITEGWRWCYYYPDKAWKEIERLREQRQDYYNEASEGWSKFRRAEAVIDIVGDILMARSIKGDDEDIAPRLWHRLQSAYERYDKEHGNDVECHGVKSDD